MDNLEFSKNLIKGKIAETIFEQMFREQGQYTVIPFGYEQTVPTLAQYQHLAEVKKVMENISDAPDFALVSNDRTRVFLVEVKYRKHPVGKNLGEIGEKLLRRWDPSRVFLATPQGFYFSPSSFVARERSIKELETTWISAEIQGNYLQLLQEFER